MSIFGVTQDLGDKNKYIIKKTIRNDFERPWSHLECNSETISLAPNPLPNFQSEDFKKAQVFKWVYELCILCIIDWKITWPRELPWGNTSFLNVGERRQRLWLETATWLWKLLRNKCSMTSQSYLNILTSR